MAKFTIYRMDVITKRRCPRDNLFRIVKGETWKLDRDYSLQGRAFYITKDRKILKNNFTRLEKLFKSEKNRELLNEILSISDD